MIKYICSKCGGDVIVTMLASYPPQTRYECLNCGAVKIVEASYNIEKVIIDFDESIINKKMQKRSSYESD